ncbi:tRNA-splicing endonuclease subunit Sen2-like [Mytilus californianus]|uniref:tRNA-splicing endonuclease subunit Sen2-like n=1 Tax=Mytilus californianus TaxID=6549 RepID=UPI002247DCDC|nr:tRNA-splicing endonuclease subunit Sen2-like [Mytilus californianus]
MAFSKLVNPKKKKRVHAVKESPFPVPIATEQYENTWFYYTGYLHGNHIEIKHSGDIDRLYKMGFFGKGTLSRSKPEFNQRFKTVAIPNGKGETINARIMSRRSYVHRLNWCLEQIEGTSPHHLEYDSSEEFKEDPDSEISKDGNSESKLSVTEDKENTSNPSIDDGSKLFHSQTKPFSAMPKDLWAEPASQWETSNTGSKEDLWEEDAEFWGDETLSATIPGINKTQNVEIHKSGDIWNDDSKKNSEFIDVTEVKDTDSSKRTNILPQVEKSQNSQKESNLEHENHGDIYNLAKETNFDQRDAISFDNSEIEMDVEIDSKQSDFQISQTNMLDNVIEFKTEKSKLSDTESSDSDLDSLYKSDDTEGDLFIVDDSDSEAEVCKRRKISRKKKKWRPVLKKDPFFVKENLHLSFEEAFFLSYGLGCLVVKDDTERTPDLTEMWQTFSSKQQTFIPNYIAYHYYRSKGWVPKTGLKFGSDFIIYKEGPAFYHGSYSVIVKMVLEDSLEEDPKYHTRDLTWTNLAGLNRLTEQVAKEVLICHVIRPNSLTEEDLLSPKCIPQFKVKEMVLSRWVSSQEREKHSEEIP